MEEFDDVDKFRSQLKDCPFCGGPSFIRSQGGDISGPRMFGASCMDYRCPGDIRVLSCTDVMQAISRWNTRA